MPTIRLQLSDFDAGRLAELARSEKRSRTSVLTEGLRSVFADRGVNILRLSPDDFEACVKVITTPESDPVVLNRRRKLRAVKPVWED